MKQKPSKKKAAPPRKTIIKSISLQQQIIDQGMERAASLSRSFSNHIAVLIQKDAAAAK